MSVNVTDPVGDEPPDTVAVKVSEAPGVEGLVPLVNASAVEVSAFGGAFTSWEVVADEAVLLPSPE